MTTPKPTLPQLYPSLETLIQSYAEIALGGGDEALKDGWRGHLMHRFLELDKEFPGSRSMIIERIKALK
jgi:hypothetical protein